MTGLRNMLGALALLPVLLLTACAGTNTNTTATSANSTLQYVRGY